MTRAALGIAATLLLLTFAGAAHADGAQGQVTGYLVPALKTYKADGAADRVVNRSDLPKPPVAIEAYGPNRLVGIRYNGQVIYLRSLEVAVTRVECVAVATPTKHSADVMAGNDMGLGAACR